MSEDAGITANLMGGETTQIQPTAELRFVLRKEPFQEQARRILQQRWSLVTYGGSASSQRFEWRDVPLSLEVS